MGEKKLSLRRQLQQKFKPYDEIDKTITKQLALCASPSSVYGEWRSYMISLEISCHGLSWLSLCCIMLWFSQNQTFQQLIVNLFFALILDIVLVAVIKATVRRGRPSGNRNDMKFTFSIDNYAFPSGHASRSVCLAVIFYVQRIGGILGSYFSIAWAVAICISRILLGRHHVGDVLAGILLGLFEAWFVLFIWFSVDTTQYILRSFSMFQKYFGDDMDVV
uniref:Phosphatidic acid phosphatase type 2/haloperoxidase domain-containing protein n=1 Tax=Strigamia maritima TaxID=126957 RepID=T1JHM8_STRMM